MAILVQRSTTPSAAESSGHVKPKTERARKLLDSSPVDSPDLIEAMMREAGLCPGDTAGTAARIRAQVAGYLGSLPAPAHCLSPQQAESVRVLAMVLVAAAKERQFGLFPSASLN